MRDIFSYIDKEKINNIYKEKSISEDRAKKIGFIINFEWDQFDKVKGLNGREICQDSPVEFMIMRLAQYLSYESEVVDLIYKDMKIAQEENFNPIIDKYIRMMELTDRKNFEKIKDKIKDLSPIKENLLKKIKIVLNQKDRKPPEGLKKVRPLKSTHEKISEIDYFIGEISFMSLITLWKIEEMLENENISLVEKIYKNTLYLYKKLSNEGNYGR